MPYVKLDTGILESTLWVDRDAREIFITALLMAAPFELKEPTPATEVRTLKPLGYEVPAGWYGFVPAAGVGIVRRAMLEIDPGLDALEKLAAIDLESRSKAHEGRRLVRIDGGYLVLNYVDYRDKDHTTAERSRRYREAKKARSVTRDVDTVTALHRDARDETVSRTRDITQADAEAEAEAYNSKDQEHVLSAIEPPKAPSEGNPPKKKKRKPGTDECFEAFWAEYPVHRGKKTAREIWKRKHLDDRIDELVLDVTNRRRSDVQWKGGFTPHPSTYLRQERWEDELKARAAATPKATPSPAVSEPKRPTMTDAERIANQRRVDDLIKATLTGRRPSNG